MSVLGSHFSSKLFGHSLEYKDESFVKLVLRNAFCFTDVYLVIFIEVNRFYIPCIGSKR